MGYSISSIKSFRYTIFLILIFFISLPAILRLLRPGFFPMYDDMQVIRLEQLDKCIKDGQIPCRWVPDLGYGFGYPLFDYYAPLPYYFMEAFHLIGFSFIDSVKIGFIGSIYYSALFFFLLAKVFFKNSTSLIITFLYIMIPFRAADVYVRGAMGEAWGLAMLPAYIWSFENFIRDKNIRSFAIFSIFGGLFLISHNLTVLMSLPLIAIWFFLRILNEKKLFKYTFLSVISSTFLASFYILPLVVGKNLVHIDTTTQGYFNFVNHFSSLKQILFSIHWGYGPSDVGANDDAFVGIGPLHALLGFLGFIIYLISKKKRNLLFFSSLFILATFYAFLMHQRSIFIWNNISYMKYFQFPWRFSLAASLILTILSGLFFDKLPKLARPLIILITVILTLNLYGNYFTPRAWLDIKDNQKLTGNARKLAVTASIYDYLPRSASINPKDPAPDSLIIQSGEAKIFSTIRGSNWYEYKIRIITEKANIVIPAYDFPVWIVNVNGKKNEYERFGELGLLSVNLGMGDHQINAKLEKTTIKKVADAVSFISLVFLLLTFYLKKYLKRSI